MQKFTLEAVARWRVGDVAFRLVLEQNSLEGDWQDHPRECFESGGGKPWRSGATPPKLPLESYNAVMAVIGSKLLVKDFEVARIRKSRDTGRMLYADAGGEWVPESCLFDTAIAARLERDRIRRLVNGWASGELQ